MADDLSPCPFCRDPMRLRRGLFTHVEQTPRCPIGGMGFQFDAVDWNTRAITDLSPLAAVAMRDAAAKQADDWHSRPYDRTETEVIADEIRALPIPDAPALLAAARQLPEVARLVEAASTVIREWEGDGQQCVPRNSLLILRAALAALGGDA